MRTVVNLQTGEILEEEDAPIIERPIEEIEAEILQSKINEASSYLTQTDWVKDYKLRHDLGLELIPEDSAKLEIINKRAEYLEILKGGN